MIHAPLFTLRAGRGAAAHIRDHGIVPLDKLLCQHWLQRVPALELIGASVGAWRAAALAQPEPVAALERPDPTRLQPL